VNLWLSDDGRLRLAWRIVLGFIVALLALEIAGILADVLMRHHQRWSDVVYRPLLMVLLLGGFSLLLIVADGVRGSPLAAIGLGRGPGWKRQAALGVTIGFGMIALAVVVIAVAGNLSFSAALNGRSLARALLELEILLTAAMSEELMFRGYPFQRLVEWLGGAAAIIVTSLLFGLAHAHNPSSSPWAVVNTVAIGALFAVAYLRTRSLWMPWGIHFAWNTTLGLVFGLPVSGLTQFSVIVKGRAQGPLWLTGGAYGIEASALGTAVVLLGFIPVLHLTRRTHLSQAVASQTGLGDERETPAERADPPASDRTVVTSRYKPERGPKTGI